METPQRMYEYEKDGAEIYRQSFATIRSEADLSGMPEDVARVAVRMVHACGQVDLVDDLVVHPSFMAAARGALQDGAPILCDATMVATGVTRARWALTLAAGDSRLFALAAHRPTQRTSGLAALLGEAAG